MATLLLALAWFLVADREPVHVYRGEHPPQTAPLPTPVSIALVLGGGGQRGFAHIGALKVLEAEGIRPDLIVGSSMGAIVGVLYAKHQRAAAVESVMLAFDPPWWRDLTLVRRPLLKGHLLEAELRGQLVNAKLEDLPLRIFAVATSVESGEPVAFSHGDAATAVRASAALPGVFKRVKIGDSEFFDGDVSAPVPVSIARAYSQAHGASIVIAVDVMSHPAGMPYEMRDYPDMALSDFYRHAINRKELTNADVVIQPELGYYISTSMEDRQRAISAGELATRAALPAIRAALDAGERQSAPTTSNNPNELKVTGRR